jgi:hypothetical protein
MRILRTPTEVKNALRYVLDNRWKHDPRRPDFFVEQDDCSSLAWLESVVVAPRTWLLQNAERALRRPPGAASTPAPLAAGDPNSLRDRHSDELVAMCKLCASPRGLIAGRTA